MQRDIDFYLKKGFDSKTAQYFANGRRHILQVIPQDNFSLLLTFDNQEKRILDMVPMLKPDTVFRHLTSYQHFQRVYLDEQGAVSWDIDPNVDSHVVWSNKLDLCPDGCYLDSIPANNH